MSSTVQARMPEDLKKQAEAVFSSLGLTPSDAIRVFFQQCVHHRGLPFPLQIPIPNDATQQAMAELRTGGGQTFKTAQALFDSWDEQTPC
jgi:DNA-damage-inducible protein J